MLNPTFSFNQLKSPSLHSLFCPSMSAPWDPLVTTRRISRNRSNPKRLTHTVKCEKETAGYNMAVVAPKEVTIKAVVTVQMTIGGMFAHLGLKRGMDDITDLLGKSLLLQLVSAELDPSMILCYIRFPIE
jgi:hypothetical protein